MQQSFGKNEIAIGDTWNVSLQFVYLICFLLFVFPNEQANTHTHTQKKKKKDYAGILFPNVVPFSMKIDGGDEKLYMDPLPPQKYFLPVSARLQGCAWPSSIPLVCVLSLLEKLLRSFPATWTWRLNICTKQMAFIWQLWWFGHRISQVLAGVQCVSDKQGMK